MTSSKTKKAKRKLYNVIAVQSIFESVVKMIGFLTKLANTPFPS